MNSETYQIGNLLLNAGTQEVTREGEPVPLPPLSFSLLLFLVRNAPNVVTIAQLEEAVWSGLVIDRGTINKRVLLVRKALRDAGCERDYITVVRGTGYRMAVPVYRIDEAPESNGGEHREPAFESPEATTPTRRNLRWVLPALLLLVLGVFGMATQPRLWGPAPGKEAVSEIPDVDTVGEAYTLYLQGRELVDRRVQGGAESLREALEKFREAARLDPKFLRAHTGIASASFLLPFYDDEVDRDEWLERAEASARFALDLDPNSAESMGILAAVLYHRGDPLRAAGLFERALELGNKDSNVLHWHAMLSTSMGYFEALLPTLQDAYRLDPLNPLLGCSLASAMNFSGKPEEALAVLEGMDPFSRRDLSAAVASLYTHDWARARALLRGIELRMGELPPRYADLLVDAFEQPSTRTPVEKAFMTGVRNGELPSLVAFEALLIMGSPRAFDLEVDLQGSYFEHHLPEAVWHNWGVELRRDSRFKGWVRVLGYDQHWRQYGWPDRCRPTGMSDFECV